MILTRDELVKELMAVPPDAPLRIALEVPEDFEAKHGVVWGSICRLSSDENHEEVRLVCEVQPYKG